MELDFILDQGPLQIKCELAQPEHGQIRRLVLGVHGIGGSSADDIQTGIAEEMALFSAATLRFDFPAHGESPLDSRYFTLEYCQDSLVAAAGELRRRYPDVEDLCIFATGFGAYVTLVTLHRLLELPGKVKLVIQTPSVRMDQTLLNMIRMSRETLAVMGSVTLRAPRPLEISFEMYEQIRVNSALTDYPIPMLILHGEQDDYIRMEDIRLLHNLNELSKLVIIPGASHQFQEEGAWDMVLDLTRDWFEFEQVLLSDWD